MIFTIFNLYSTIYLYFCTKFLLNVTFLNNEDVVKILSAKFNEIIFRKASHLLISISFINLF